MIKGLYFTIGILSVILGLIGAVLPLMPTVPFLIIAIYCFERSSKKFHDWSMSIPGVRERIEDWRKYRVIRKKTKFQATFLMLCSGIIIILKESLSLNIKIMVLAILGITVAFIITRASHPPPTDEKSNVEDQM